MLCVTAENHSSSVSLALAQARWRLTRMRIITSRSTRSTPPSIPSRGVTSRFCPDAARACGVVVGDGRLQLAQASNGAFDLLMLDAFSSDSIPTHLLSREALQLYLSKLAPDGILLFHVSNRYLNVERLVSALVADAGLAGFSRSEDAGDLRKEGKTNSNHVVAARRLEDLGSIATHPGWKRVVRPPQFKLWTDDYSNLLSLIRWF